MSELSLKECVGVNFFQPIILENGWRNKVRHIAWSLLNTSLVFKKYENTKKEIKLL